MKSYLMPNNSRCRLSSTWTSTGLIQSTKRKIWAELLHCKNTEMIQICTAKYELIKVCQVHLSVSKLPKHAAVQLASDLLAN